VLVTVGAVIVALLLTGYFSATAGKASRPKAMIRILIGGLLAMAATYGVGTLFGAFV
jgi:VIT1/CCC1 family predicted Fe2+/Mn2+ transporter